MESGRGVFADTLPMLMKKPHSTRGPGTKWDNLDKLTAWRESDPYHAHVADPRQSRQIRALICGRRRELEHVPSQLNQGDSLGAKDERVYRH